MKKLISKQTARHKPKLTLSSHLGQNAGLGEG